MTKRVVITGMGVISPVGNNVEDAWSSLVAGKSGIGTITAFDASGQDVRIAGEVKNFNPTDFIDRKEARRMDRYVQFAVAATRQALSQADLKIDASNTEDTGVIIGSGIGGIITLSEQFKVLHDKGPLRLSPFLVPMMIADMASGHVSILFGCKGPNFATVSACATGAHAIGEATAIIKRGDAKVMIAGGSEAPICPIGVGGFASMKALCSDHNDSPETACRPFDAKRSGFVLAEGAGVIVLEDYEYAVERGAHILAEVVGYGSTADAYHITSPDGEGATRAMTNALREAGIKPEVIDYINAHGTSTHYSEKFETMAIKKALGEYAYKVPISSTKSMTGHLLGAAGAVETIWCVKALESGIIPPTINYEFPDPECDLDYVPNKAREAKIDYTLSNSFGFGGHNVALILKRVEA